MAVNETRSIHMTHLFDSKAAERADALYKTLELDGPRKGIRLWKFIDVGEYGVLHMKVFPLSKDPTSKSAASHPDYVALSYTW
jgi:hypothetical protein